MILSVGFYTYLLTFPIVKATVSGVFEDNVITRSFER